MASESFALLFPVIGRETFRPDSQPIDCSISCLGGRWWRRWCRIFWPPALCDRLVRSKLFGESCILGSIPDSFRLHRNGFVREALAKPQRCQAGIGFGKGRSQADGCTKCIGGLGLLVAKTEDLALLQPEDRVVLLGRHSAANELLRQVEVTLVHGFPGFLRKFPGPAAVFLFLLLGVHLPSSLRTVALCIVPGNTAR